jgi:outer membrane protein assembly factor BamB
VPPSSNRAASLPRWRVKLCAANSPAGANWDEVTHNLLTLHEDSIYCNSNLGVVAAISTDGQVRWITSYPRSALRPRDPDQSDLHYMRDLNPCLLYGDCLIVAPTDTDKVFALDANTGQVRWEISLADVVHLLGVGAGNLLAGGDSLYWIDVRSGKVVGQFPQPTKRPKPELSRVNMPGYGRGVLADDLVYWPTRERIFVFKQQTQKIQTADKRFVWEPIGERVIDLRPRGVKGGNLVIANGVMLIAGANGLVAFDEFGPKTAE